VTRLGPVLTLNAHRPKLNGCCNVSWTTQDGVCDYFEKQLGHPAMNDKNPDRALRLDQGL